MKNRGYKLFTSLTISIVMIFAYLIFTDDKEAIDRSDNLQVDRTNGKVDIIEENKDWGGYGIVAGELETSLRIMKVNDQYVVEFRIKNQTEKLQTMSFTSGQKFDYIIKRDGKQIHKYSTGMNFTMAMEEKTLKQGEEIIYKETLPVLDPGSYTLSFWSTAKNHDINKTLDIDIEN